MAEAALSATRVLFVNGCVTKNTSSRPPHRQYLFLPFSSSCSSPLSCFSLQFPPRRTPSATRLSCSLSTSQSASKSPAKVKGASFFSEGRDEDEHRLVCPGCGIFMQDADPNRPGYYQKRVPPSTEASSSDEMDRVDGEDEEDEEWEENETDAILDEEGDEIEFLSSKSDFDDEMSELFGGASKNGIDWESEWDPDEEEEKFLKDLDGFTPAGPGYGNVTEEFLEKRMKPKISKSEKKKKLREAKRSEAAEDVATVCARCHSLRNYGQVKNQGAENLIPDFDFDRFISSRLMKPMISAPVVLMVVDCLDFDGSFPKRAAKSLFKALEAKSGESKLSKLPKLVLVGTKVDLLPSQISPTRLDQWARNRAKAAGAPKLNAVYLVSSRKDIGVRNLVSYVKELAGPRGNVWVIGAQNAGKSTLINAFAKREGVKSTRLTEAAVPGTTLGILRIPNILPAKAKMYDTPGLLHPYLMMMRLTREEQRMVEIRKELQPRTYRMKVGQTVHVGGLVRLDLTEASVETIYVTIWASPNVSLHTGKTENADEIRDNHFGIRLQPPVGQDRISEQRDWIRKEVKISGISWDVNSMDLAVSGLGWFSLGLKGVATVALWTFDRVLITQREPLVLDRAPFLERPGFWLPKAISDAINDKNKMEAKSKKLKQKKTDFLLEANI